MIQKWIKCDEYKLVSCNKGFLFNISHNTVEDGNLSDLQLDDVDIYTGTEEMCVILLNAIVHFLNTDDNKIFIISDTLKSEKEYQKLDDKENNKNVTEKN